MNSNITRKIYTFLNGKYLFDVIYNHYFIGRGLQLGYFVSKVLDRGVIEFIGPYGLSNTLNNTGLNISKLDTGVITTYSLYITLGLLSLVFLVFSPVLLDTSMLNEIRLFIIYLATLLLVFTPYSNTHYLFKDNASNLNSYLLDNQKPTSLAPSKIEKVIIQNNNETIISEKLSRRDLLMAFKTVKKVNLTIVTTMIIKLIKNLVNLVNKNHKNKYHYSFILPLIFSKLDIDVSNIKVTDFSYAILILSIIALYSFINIIGYMVSYIYIQNGNLEMKYPRFKKIIAYFKKSSLFFITIEVIIVIFCLLTLIISSLCFIYMGIKL